MKNKGGKDHPCLALFYRAAFRYCLNEFADYKQLKKIGWYYELLGVICVFSQGKLDKLVKVIKVVSRVASAEKELDN